MTKQNKCNQICEDLVHTKNIAKYNSKFGQRFYKLDPWYKQLVDAHLESDCKICNPDFDKPKYFCRKCSITFPTKFAFENHTTCTSWCS